MTAAQTQILDLFRALTPEEREALLPSLVGSLDEEDIFDGLTPEEVAAIEEGVAQADRGEVEDSNAVFDRLAADFNFRRA